MAPFQPPNPAYPDWAGAYSLNTSSYGLGGAGYGGTWSGPGPMAGGQPTSVGSYPQGKVDPRTAIVVGSGNWTFAPASGIVLSQLIDDAMVRMGPHVYELMLRDDAIKASIDALKLGALGQGIQAMPAIIPEPGERVNDNERKRKIDLAKKLADECNRLTGRLSSFHDTMEEMLDGLIYGSSLAEKTWEKAVDGPDRGKIVLSSLVVKPRGAWAFVVNNYMEVKAFWVWSDDGPITVTPAKFATFTWAPRNGDPRGTSILRACFDPWTFKMQGKPYRAKFLSLFSDPTAVCKYNAEKQGQPVYPPGSDGLPDYTAMPLSADQQAAAIAANIHSGSWAAIPSDWSLDFLEARVDGGAFDRNEDACDRAMARVILLSARTTMEAQHSSKADGGQAQDVTDLRYGRVQKSLMEMVKKDLYFEYTKLNYGMAVADELCPTATLAKFGDNSTPPEITAFVGAGWSLTPRQMAEVDAKLGVTPRTADEIDKLQAMLDAEAAQANAAAAPAPAVDSDPNAAAVDPNAATDPNAVANPNAVPSETQAQAVDPGTVDTDQVDAQATDSEVAGA